MINRIFGWFILLGLTACQVPNVSPFSVYDFRGETPIPIAVSDIQITDKTVRYPDLPHIETRIPIVPAYALEQALKNRFQATGEKSSQTTFIIEEASLTQQQKMSDHWYIYDNIEYRLDYRVRILYAWDNITKEEQTITGWETQSLPRRSSLSDKESVWQKMINAMITKVTDKIQADIPSPLR